MISVCLDMRNFECMYVYLCIYVRICLRDCTLFVSVDICVYALCIPSVPLNNTTRATSPLPPLPPGTPQGDTTRIMAQSPREVHEFPPLPLALASVSFPSLSSTSPLFPLPRSCASSPPSLACPHFLLILVSSLHLYFLLIPSSPVILLLLSSPSLLFLVPPPFFPSSLPLPSYPPRVLHRFFLSPSSF